MKNLYKIFLLSLIIYAFFLKTSFADSIIGLQYNVTDSSSQSGIKDEKRKICLSSDSIILNEIKFKRIELLNKSEELSKQKNELENKTYNDSKTSKELKKQIKEISRDLKKTENEIDKLNNKMQSMMRKVEDIYLDRNKNVIRFIGTGTIEKDEVMNSNICVINGDLTVKGKILGDLAIINGLAIVQDSGLVEGKVILVNAEFVGDSTRKNLTECGDISDFEKYSINYFPFWYSFPNYRFPPLDFIDDGIFRYDKVEGLFLGLKSSKKYYWNGSKRYSFSGSIGFGFSNHRWTGNLAFDRWIGNTNRTEFGVDIHSLTDSKDNRLIDPLENSLAAFIIHEDFKDYFLREGWNIHIAQYINRDTRLRVDYFEDNYYSMTNHTDWSLFGGHKVFRENPSIDDGLFKSVIFSLNHTTIDDKKFQPQGWDISANYEMTSGKLSFNRLYLDIRRYQQIESDERLNFRFIAGSSEKYLPIQKSYDLGGLGTMPALPFKVYSGMNRMLLANIEYITGFHDLFTVIFDEDYNDRGNTDLIFFYDAGWSDRVADDEDILKGFEIKNNIKQDLGIAIGFNKNTMRIGAAFRLDKTEPATFFFRISRPF